MTIENIKDKMNELAEEELDIIDDVKRKHDLDPEAEIIDVPLNWDEERDFEYLYDRADLFEALYHILNDMQDNQAAQHESFKILLSDVNDVIAERQADITKAQAVIDDMERISETCREALTS